MVNLMNQAFQNQSKDKIKNFFADYLLVTSINKSMVKFSKKWELLCHRIKTKEDLERYYRSQGKISKAFGSVGLHKRRSVLKRIKMRMRDPENCVNIYYMSQIKRMWIISMMLGSRDIRRLFYAML